MSPLVSSSVSIAMPLLFAAAGLCVFRALRGPSLPDRILAVDLIAAIAAAIVFLDGLRGQDPRMLDPAVVIVLISFISTIAFARIMEAHWHE